MATCGSATQENVTSEPETTSDGVNPTVAPASSNGWHCKIESFKMNN